MADKTGEKPDLEIQPHGGALKRGPGPGRPPGSVSIVKKLKEALAEDGNDEKLAKAIIKHAMHGNGTAIKAVLDRVDGKLADLIQFPEKKRDLTKLTDEELVQLRALEAKVEDAGGD